MGRPMWEERESDVAAIRGRRPENRGDWQIETWSASFITGSAQKCWVPHFAFGATRSLEFCWAKVRSVNSRLPRRLRNVKTLQIIMVV